MERYVAIVSKSDNMYALVEINSDTLSVVRRVLVSGFDIANAVVGCRPINFSVENGVLKESMGSLERLTVKNGVRPHIVVQELATSLGTIVGYRLLNPSSNSIVAMKKEDIIARQANSNVPLLQNGIIRGNKINCYSHSKFPRFVIGTKTRTASKKPKVASEAKVMDTNSNSTGNKSNFLDKFTPEQRRELSMAKKDGVDVKILANPELSPEQMRVIWVSKKKGVYSEYFASPKYSVDVMKFYADKFVTMQVVKECSDLLARPDYDIERLSELYLAVCEGIDYSGFIDAKSAEEMYVQREKLRTQLWGTSESIDTKFKDSGLKLVNKIKRG